jgi:hypothetical protein
MNSTSVLPAVTALRHSYRISAGLRRAHKS